MRRRKHVVFLTILDNPRDRTNLTEVSVELTRKTFGQKSSGQETSVCVLLDEVFDDTTDAASRNDR